MSDRDYKKITILGATGSIGSQTLETIENLGGYTVAALTGNANVAAMEKAVRKYNPTAAAMEDEKSARELKTRLNDTPVRVLSGEEGVIEAARLDADITVSSIVGIAGLRPTMAAIEQGGRRIALANKETLVCAGRLVMRAIEENGCELIPVDSEHSAIFQSLMGGRKSELKRILLTASGGPFRTLPIEKFPLITRETALKHPNWVMGAKISIDSATMMNKGLEVIEAMHLFSVPAEKIKVVVHPESILHSAVEFCDGAVMAQLGLPDMRVPIQLALTYPERAPSLAAPLDLAGVGRLTFEEPDFEKFPCLKIAMGVAQRADAAPVVMNAANEAAVGLFLEDKIGYLDIPRIIENAVEKFGGGSADTIEEILNRDRETRNFVLKD